MDRGAWRATVQGGCKESDMPERLGSSNSEGIPATRSQGL